jgi:hypothetical protein
VIALFAAIVGTWISSGAGLSFSFWWSWSLGLAVGLFILARAIHDESLVGHSLVGSFVTMTCLFVIGLRAAQQLWLWGEEDDD